jgi:SsrA-binding protein
MKKQSRRGHKKASSGQARPIVNRRASFDYDLGNELIVGLELTGAEAKAARLGHVQLRGSYVTIRGSELWLINASFSLPTGEKGGGSAVDSRSRRLLAHRKQIDDFIRAKQDGLTIVPTKLLGRGRYVKLVIAAGRGKKRYDKRQTIRQRDIERDNRRHAK